MTVAAQRAAAIVLFLLFAAYGFEALTIPLFPGQETEPFKPRTMPVALAAVGMLLAAIRILRLFRTPPPPDAPLTGRFRWRPAALLCVAMLAYGYLMIPLGFVLSTTLFLCAGFVVLGERRRAVLLFLPLAFSLAFFLLMTEGLGLYLAPGAWFGL